MMYLITRSNTRSMTWYITSNLLSAAYAIQWLTGEDMFTISLATVNSFDVAMEQLGKDAYDEGNHNAKPFEEVSNYFNEIRENLK